MSMPQIPEEKFRPCLEDTVIDLLESIALEEIALSHLVNAESEKIQTFLCAIKDSYSCHKSDEFIKFNSSIGKIIDTVIMKEWILLKKLENVMQIDYKPHHKDCECGCDKHKNDDCKKDSCGCSKHNRFDWCEDDSRDDKCYHDDCWEKECNCGCGNCVRIKVKCNCNHCNDYDD